MESAPLLQLALGPNSAAVRLDDVFHDGKAKTRSTLFARARLVHTIKPLENSFQRIRRNAGTIIGHGDLDACITERSSADLHVSIFAAVLDGIVDEVRKDLLQALQIGANDEIRPDE